MRKTQLLSGNEAIALAARQAGCRVASAYPGTPSTEIMENIAKYKDRIAGEWSTNEKVAMEVAIGASLGGARTLCAMKHVGLNVALDPIMTFTFIGTTGGLVIVVADDPGMHSSQNEQDSRNLVKFARAPLLEPSDSQEAFDMTVAAFDLSEQYQAPVFLRTTTRTSHSSGIVSYEDADSPAPERKPYVKNIQRTVAVPAYARPMRLKAEERTATLKAAAEASTFNREEPGDKRLGIVTSAVAYQHVKEVFPEFSVLKLGFTNPLPLDLVTAFAAKVDRLVVVEELDPFMADQLHAAGLAVVRPKVQLHMMELNPVRLAELRQELLGDVTPAVVVAAPTGLPTRPPVLCAGCGHRGVFFTLNKLKATVLGDIGCYTLGAFPPLSAMDTTICMGASIGSAIGMRKAGHPGRIAAIIGDSTFFHSGMTGLLDAVYNRVPIAVIVLDNRTTAMTGHQEHPGTGHTLTGDEAPAADIVAIARALGVKTVRDVAPYDMATLETVLKEALDATETSVVVVRGPCVLAAKLNVGAVPYVVDEEKCVACGACFRLGCPAIIRGKPHGPDGKRYKRNIHSPACIGCDLCRQVCKFDAIHRQGE
jgi:indolepyruvate ferredoxin oxidoreductase alpha subunit